MNNFFSWDMDKYRTIADLAQSVTDRIINLFKAEASLFFLADAETDRLRLIAGSPPLPFKPGDRDLSGTSGNNDDFTVSIDEFSFPGWCALHNEALFSNNPKDETDITGIFCRFKAGNAGAVPIRRYGKCIGVILAMDKQEGFTDDDLAEMQKIADELPPVLSYVAMREDLEDLETHFSDMVTRGVDNCTVEGSGHVHRVAALCSELSAIMDIPENIRRKLWKAAIYHDVGKILLQGRAPWEIERFHPGEGASYLRGIRVLKDIACIVETSHERYDGSGFPSGLAGDVVPIEAWILALAEDLEEFSHQNQAGFFEDILRQYFLNNAESHHPLVMEALGALINSGAPENVLRGWKR